MTGSMPAMHIATDSPRVVLRSWEVRDIPALLRNANDRAVWRNLTDTFPSPYTEADAQGWIDIANDPTGSVHLAIEVDGECAGGVGIVAAEGIACRTGQLGYWLGRTFWGRGIATVAAHAMVRYAAQYLSFARLEAVVFEWNPASMRVLEKTGFTREGILRRSVFKDDALIDSVMYAQIFDR